MLLLFRKDLEAAVDSMLQRLGIDCIDLLQLTDPHRYVPRQELGEDTYCWGVGTANCMRICVALLLWLSLSLLSCFNKSYSCAGSSRSTMKAHFLCVSSAVGEARCGTYSRTT